MKLSEFFAKHIIKAEAAVIDEIPQWKIEHPEWTFDRQAAGIKAAATNRERYTKSFYKQIGEKGGKRSSNSEWAMTPEGQEHMRKAGTKGGAISRRAKP